MSRFRKALLVALLVVIGVLGLTLVLLLSQGFNGRSAFAFEMGLLIGAGLAAAVLAAAAIAFLRDPV